MIRGNQMRFVCFTLAAGLWAGFLIPSAAAAPHLFSKSEDRMPPEQMASVRGQKIIYYEAGQGATVIFLHGLGADSGHWVHNIGPISEKYRVIALDQIGFGRSSKPLIDYKISTFVELLQSFMEALGIPKATLVGNSLGGWIAADFAIRHPDMVDKLVLVDAAGLRLDLRASSPLPDFKLTSVSGMRKTWKFLEANKLWVTEDLGPDAFERHLKNGDNLTIASVVADIVLGNQFEDDRLGSVHTPTLILWGRDDVLIPLSYGERFQKAIPGAKLVVLKDCSHLPMMQKPKEFNKALLKFLKQR